MCIYLKMDKVDLKKKPPWKIFFCISFQSSHQVYMKNVVECPREFFAYFNALETYSVLSLSHDQYSKFRLSTYVLFR